MIVTVYAICKNEAMHAVRWFNSMREADNVVVLDTGSSDDSVKILRRLGARVETANIEPWRFDTARNLSMQLIPPNTDICVCTDLDEVFERGWRRGLEKAWVDGAKQARYNYVWSHEGDNPGVTFLIEKAHALGSFRWENPVHEVLKYDGKDYKMVTADVNLHHYPDLGKSRESYLPLLELAVRENPMNDRNVHYLGREYMLRGEWAMAIATLKNHLSLPTATWADERAASMRYIARCCTAAGVGGAEEWYLRAIAEAPNVREGYVEYARLLFSKEDWAGVAFMLEHALKITVRSASYINEPDAWGALPYDLLSLSYYHLGNKKPALEMVEMAIRLSPDKRLRVNREHFMKMK